MTQLLVQFVVILKQLALTLVHVSAVVLATSLLTLVSKLLHRQVKSKTILPTLPTPTQPQTL